MPPFLIGLILDLVLKFGIPVLVVWLKKLFKIEATSQTVSILSDYVEESKSDRLGARMRARRRLRECHGVDCPT